MNETPRFDTATRFEDIRDDDGYRVDLHASELPQWISDAKRDAEAAATTIAVPERLTKEQEASRTIRGFGNNLSVFRSDATRPRNMLEEDETQSGNWMGIAA